MAPRFLAPILLGLGLVITAALLAESFVTAGVRGWDAITYIAAGERLNDGHELYALSPGDRPILLKPPYWTVPLLSPPPIAVVWRPLAALPNELGIGVWWIACALGIMLAIGALARRLPLAAGVALVLLAPSLAWELKVANVNGLLLPGVLAVWLLARRNDDTLAGALIAAMAAVKLWPAVLLVWFASQQRWRAVLGFAAGSVIALTVSVAGAGADAHLEYLGIARGTPPSLFSIPGLVGALGVDLPWLSYAVLAFGVTEVFALRRRRPELAFAVTVGVMILGSPVVNINTYVLLIACLAPFAWPFAWPLAATAEAVVERQRPRDAVLAPP